MLCLKGLKPPCSKTEPTIITWRTAREAASSSRFGALLIGTRIGSIRRIVVYAYGDLL